MNYEVYLTETFQKCVKILKKKYRHIKEDLTDAVQILKENPNVGDSIPGWNKEIWKIRAVSSDIKKGKRTGFRIIYLWKTKEFNVYLLAIYFKGEKENISKKEIENLLRKLNQELEI